MLSCTTRFAQAAAAIKDRTRPPSEWTEGVFDVACGMTLTECKFGFSDSLFYMYWVLKKHPDIIEL